MSIHNGYWPAIPTRIRVRFRFAGLIQQKFWVRVRVGIVCYMDAQTVVRFGIADLNHVMH